MIADDGDISLFSPSKGEQNLWAMMESLATVKATGPDARWDNYY